MTIPEKYAHYFTQLDTPSVITDLNLKILWKNDAVKTFYQSIRKSASMQYYVSKQQFAQLKRLQPGETINVSFYLGEVTPGFAKRKDDCYIFRISRFNAAAQKRITELFDARYLSSGNVASFVPDIKNEPIHQISVNKLDRLAALFEGLHSGKLTRMDITTPLSQFARQATCALYGIKVKYTCSLNYMAADFNVADLYMALSAMTACAITYAPYEEKIFLEAELVGTDIIIHVKCKATGFAVTLADVYKDYEKLDALCEYGAHYLNLLLINVLCEHYDWYFDISEDGEFTSFSIKLSAKWDGYSPISLFSEEMNDDIIETLLIPFRKEPDNKHSAD